MINKDKKIIDSSKDSILGELVCINDLRDLEYNNVDITPQQRLAIKNYDRYRIFELNKQYTESEYHKKYLQLQVMANLTPFQEFLKEKYFI